MGPEKGQKMTIDWAPIYDALKLIYKEQRISPCFKRDEEYLHDAFLTTETLWSKQFHRIRDIKVIMLSEAPLFGETQSYIYNLKSNPTAFFHFNDLRAFDTFSEFDQYTEGRIQKQVMFDQFAKKGFLVVDLFPFALNSDFTALNYRVMKKKAYVQLLNATLEHYLIPKLKQCSKKSIQTPLFVFRYKKLLVRTSPQVLGAIRYVFPDTRNVELNSINGTNMSLDRMKLSKILK